MAEYISREDALEILHKVRYECVYNRQNVMYDGKVDTYKALVARFKAMPAADVVERKRGKWITEDGKPLPYGVCFSVCSECGHSSPASGFSFCPNCGADMREPPKESES